MEQKLLSSLLLVSALLVTGCATNKNTGGNVETSSSVTTSEVYQMDDVFNYDDMTLLDDYEEEEYIQILARRAEQNRPTSRLETRENYYTGTFQNKKTHKIDELLNHEVQQTYASENQGYYVITCDTKNIHTNETFQYCNKRYYHLDVINDTYHYAENYTHTASENNLQYIKEVTNGVYHYKGLDNLRISNFDYSNIVEYVCMKYLENPMGWRKYFDIYSKDDTCIINFTYNGDFASLYIKEGLLINILEGHFANKDNLFIHDIVSYQYNVEPLFDKNELTSQSEMSEEQFQHSAGYDLIKRV